jgi:alkylation response protein AidB-like acyl-CoA dehydrogenase
VRSVTEIEFSLKSTYADRSGTPVAGAPALHGADTALTAATTTDDDIRQLRAALRGALGVSTDDLPTVDPQWRAGWPVLAELALPAFCVPEDRGGFGLQSAVAVGAAEELGAALHGGPYAGLTASAHALARAGRADADEVLAGVLSGQVVCGFGVVDPSGRRAWLVDGAPDADALVLVDPTTTASSLLTERADWTVEEAADPFDVSRAGGTVVVDPGRGVPLGPDPVALDLQRLLLAADAVGCVQRMHERTVTYAGQRIAFGRPIGGFQAVQHRLADHAVAVRAMALVVAEAAALLDAGSDRAARQVALAAVHVHGNAVGILHDLLQLTGGIGFTWEYGLHFYERRAHHDARLSGGRRAAVRSLAGLEGWAP